MLVHSSFREHRVAAAAPGRRVSGRAAGRGALKRFSAYSLLMYLNDDFQGLLRARSTAHERSDTNHGSLAGGCTTFFAPDPAIVISRRGLTPLCERESLTVVAEVAPRRGDVLIFPHGTHPGCHPSPLHEGSTVCRPVPSHSVESMQLLVRWSWWQVKDGQKLLIRTDVVYHVCETKSKTKTKRSAVVQQAQAAPSSAIAAVAALHESLDGLTRRLSHLELMTSAQTDQHATADTSSAQAATVTPTPDLTAVAKLESLLECALEHICPAYAAMAAGTVKQISERGGPDLESNVAAAVFWAAYRDEKQRQEQQRSEPPQPQRNKSSGDPSTTITSEFGVQRRVTRRQLAQLVIDALPPFLQPDRSEDSFVAVYLTGEGHSGAIQITTAARRNTMATVGRVACVHCGHFVVAKTGGLEWHLKTAHGLALTDHAQAASAAAAAAVAIVPYSSTALGHSQRCGDRFGAEQILNCQREASGNTALKAADLEAAQRDPATLQLLVRAGRVQSLGPGLDACRAGDLQTLRKLVEGPNATWDPTSPDAVDRNGSNALLWAAGGGHLPVCQYLCDVCGVDPVTAVADNRRARRGYSGRTALHWAARNGHVAILRWLLDSKSTATSGVNDGKGKRIHIPSHTGTSQKQERKMVDVNLGTADGTTAFCWAVWQGQLEAARFLWEEARCNPHAANSYGCNAAMWAAQGGHLAVCRFLHSMVRVDFSTVNANGQGCLHKAAQRGHADVVRWLLSPEVALLGDGEKLHPRSCQHIQQNRSEGEERAQSFCRMHARKLQSEQTVAYTALIFWM
eukprot:SAG31_NODE_67_length_28318_cov_6.493674_34_plen_798_part_00